METVLDQFQFVPKYSFLTLHGPVRYAWRQRQARSVPRVVLNASGVLSSSGGWGRWFKEHALPLPANAVSSATAGLYVALTAICTAFIAAVAFAVLYRFILKPRLAAAFLKMD